MWHGIVRLYVPRPRPQLYRRCVSTSDDCETSPVIPFCSPSTASLFAFTYLDEMIVAGLHLGGRNTLEGLDRENAKADCFE